MAKVVRTFPVPVTPPAVVTLTLSEDEAAYVLGVLASGNQYKSGLSNDIPSVYSTLSNAFKGPGFSTFFAKVGRATTAHKKFVRG